MFEGLDDSHIGAALEAVLFVSDEAVSESALATLLEVDTNTIQQALREVQARLAQEQSGIQLLEMAGGWRLYTHPAYHELLEKYVLSWDTRKLSAAALEVLAIVAYLQPLTRTQIAAIRGVTSDGPLNTLLERGYVREAGSADAPGTPTLFATTRTFLEKYGLSSLKDLPPLEAFAPDEEAAQLIRQRLGAITSAQVSVEVVGEEGTRKAEGAGEGQAKDGAGGVGVSGGAQSDGRVSSFDVDALAAEATTAFLGVVEKIDFDKLTFNTDDE